MKGGGEIMIQILLFVDLWIKIELNAIKWSFNRMEQQHLNTFNMFWNGNDFVWLSIDFQSKRNKAKKEKKKTVN